MDILADLQARLEPHARSPRLRAELLAVIAAVRRDWSGERCYIAAAARDSQAHASARDAAIRRAWHAGERAPALARLFGISRQRVYQIVREGDPLSNALP